MIKFEFQGKLLKCFEYSLTLKMNVNEIDKKNDACLTYLERLNCNGNYVEILIKVKRKRQKTVARIIR